MSLSILNSQSRKVKYSTKNCFCMSKPSDLGSLKIGSYILPHSINQVVNLVVLNMILQNQENMVQQKQELFRGIFDGQKRPHVGPVSMQIHVPMINKKRQIISMTGDTVQLWILKLLKQ